MWVGQGGLHACECMKVHEMEQDIVYRWGTLWEYKVISSLHAGGVLCPLDYMLPPLPTWSRYTHWLRRIKVVQVLLENHRSVVTKTAQRQAKTNSTRNAVNTKVAVNRLLGTLQAALWERACRLHLRVTMGSSAGRRPHGPVNRAQSLAAACG